MATTLEEVKKAYEDLSDEDKKTFEQSIADRVHESVGEQEAEAGDKDEQTAADREHEAEGAEHADGEGEVEELHKTDFESHVDADDVAHEEAQGANVEEHKEHDDERFAAIDERLARIEQMLTQQQKRPQEADGATSDRLSEYAKKFE